MPCPPALSPRSCPNASAKRGVSHRTRSPFLDGLERQPKGHPNFWGEPIGISTMSQSWVLKGNQKDTHQWGNPSQQTWLLTLPLSWRAHCQGVNPEELTPRLGRGLRPEDLPTNQSETGSRAAVKCHGRRFHRGFPLPNLVLQ